MSGRIQALDLTTMSPAGERTLSLSKITVKLQYLSPERSTYPHCPVEGKLVAICKALADKLAIGQDGQLPPSPKIVPNYVISITNCNITMKNS